MVPLSPDTLQAPYALMQYMFLIYWHTKCPLFPDTPHAPYDGTLSAVNRFERLGKITWDSNGDSKDEELNTVLYRKTAWN